MPITLVIDIGNTNIAAGLFSGSRLVKKTKAPTDRYSQYPKTFKPLLNGGVNGIIISSVVPLALMRLVCELKKITCTAPVILGYNKKVPIKNLYRKAEEVGQDRLVNAFGVRALYGSPAVIIDFGTAITFDIVSRNGSYMGGLILPGIEMGLRSLHEKTALLPKVGLKPSSQLIGRDTVNSMRAGILFGYGAMCDGLISRYKDLLGRGVKVVATGGNAKLIKRYAGSIGIVDEDLTLKALGLLASG